jgi:hypothetical protein
VRRVGGLLVLSRVVNPIVRWLLRSPLHPLLSRRLLVLEVTGVRSGRTFSFPVQYGRDGDAFVVVPGFARRKRWWRNLRRPAPVGYWWRGHRYEGTGAVVADRDVAARSLAAYAAGRRRSTKSLDPDVAVVVRIEPSLEPQGGTGP